MQQERIARHKGLAIAIACFLALGLSAFALDVTTVRIAPDPSVLKTPTYNVFPGELIRVELGPGWTAVKSSNPAVVVPLGGNAFVAGARGVAVLSAATLRCPRCLGAMTLLWRANVRVGFLGT